MGVPALFRWLSRKYPKIISQVVEEPPTVVDDVEYPADYSRPNPNGELDNLYLDMNGIVHPCTHPEGRPAPETEDEMMLEVFKYTDRVVSMARPRKVLMMAVDGVAPRAKMNQQRSRRFRTAQDAKMLAEAKEKAMQDAEARGEIIDESIKGKRVWDSNAITPGTPFMDTLAISLRYWVAYKMNNDPGWKDVKVIISDANVPGEGEHKIMEFIRSQRSDPAHDPNTSHCIYGLDADLIFLGLATHEPHFKILREDVFADNNRKRGNQYNNNNNDRQFGISAADQERIKKEEEVEKSHRKPFIWLHVDILREYLEIELKIPHLSFPFDFERAIDDWVFMCFFVGNDFLPHLPSLDVRDNSIDTLLNIWKRNLNAMKGYMTCDGQVNLGRVEIMMKGLGDQEDYIFRKRRDNDLRRLENEKRRKLEKDQLKAMNNAMLPPPAGLPPVPAVSKNRGERAPVAPLENMPLYTTSGESVGATHMTNSEIVTNRNAINLANMANKSAAQALKSQMLSGKASSDNQSVEPETTVDTSSTTVAGVKRKAEEDLVKEPAKEQAKQSTIGDEDENDEFDEAEDNIRLWEPGYRDRYYQHKFHVSAGDTEFKKEVVRKYIEGTCWALLYYYQGCQSWNWYFPYHYAPFAADLTDLSGIEIKFGKSEPFRPYEQLMSVLPAASSHNLPAVFAPLMQEQDSEIIDFYPEDFPIDMNGKKMAWQGIALLPFIDEQRLLAAVQKKYELLTPQESARNERKQEVLVISRSNELYKDFEKLYAEELGCEKVAFDSKKGHGLAGTIKKEPGIVPGSEFVFPLKGDSMSDIPRNDSIQVLYAMPPKVENHYHKSMLLNGVKLRDPVLTSEEREAVMNGFRRNNQNGYNNYNNNNSNGYYNNGYKDRYNNRKNNRPGGYKYFVENKNSQQQQYGGYGQGGYSGYERGYNQQSQGGGYNQGYNQGGYNQGYNQYNQGYNQGYNQYNQGYTQGYRQGYNQPYNSGYNNQGHNTGYIPPPSRSYDQKNSRYQQYPGNNNYPSSGYNSRGGYNR